MAPITQQQAQVVDPVLSRLAQQHAPDPSRFIHRAICPLAEVPNIAGTYIRSDKSGFVEVDIRLGESQDIPEVERGWTDEQVLLEERGLAGRLSQNRIDQARRGGGGASVLRLESRETTLTMRQVDLQIEIAAADMVQDPTNYDPSHVTALAGGARWDNLAANPQETVSDAKSTVRRKAGREPNVLALGYDVCRKLLLREDIKEELYGDMPRLDATMSMAEKLQRLARYFMVDEVHQAQALKVATADDADFVDVWGDIAWLGCSELHAPDPTMTLDSITWGATLRWEGYPQGNRPWYRDRNRTWYYPFTTFDTPRAITRGAAWLFQTAVTP